MAKNVGYLEVSIFQNVRFVDSFIVFYLPTVVVVVDGYFATETLFETFVSKLLQNTENFPHSRAHDEYKSNFKNKTSLLYH